ncbi:hypothetical protein ACFQDR_22110 [Sulfitobacter sediminilitoris]
MTPNSTTAQAAAPQGGGKAPDGFALLMRAIVKGPAAMMSVVSEGQTPINNNSGAQLLASLSGSGEERSTLAAVQPTEATDELLASGDALGVVDPGTVTGVPAAVLPAPAPTDGKGVVAAGSVLSAVVKTVAEQLVPSAPADKGPPQFQNGGPAVQPATALASNGGQSVVTFGPSPTVQVSQPSAAISVQPDGLQNVEPTAGILTSGRREASAQNTGGTSPMMPSAETADQNVAKLVTTEVKQTPVPADKPAQTASVKTEMPPVPSASTGPSPAQQGVPDSPVKTAQTAATIVVPDVAVDVAGADPRRTNLKSRLAQIKTETAALSPAASSKSAVVPLATQAEQETLPLADQTRPETVKVSEGVRPTFLTDQPGTKAAAPVGAPVHEHLQDVPAARPVDTSPPHRAENSAVASASRAEDAGPKAAPKPFADALISQIKSVDVSQNRTVVNLHPRGLGTIEVEVIGEKDLASKVVVRVENPAVLQALRDERQLLAHTIGVADSSVLEFRDNETGTQSDGGQDQGAKSGGVFDGSGTEEAHRERRDIVDHGQLDILT